MATPDVHVRVCEQELLRYDLEIKALIQVRFFLWCVQLPLRKYFAYRWKIDKEDITECDGPQSKLTEINTDVKKHFHNLRLRIQDFERIAMEQDKESDKQALLSRVEGHRKQMLSNQTAWRKANLASKLSIDKMEKQALLNGAVKQRKMTKRGLAQNATDITENLMSISRMMAQQVQQSEETITTIATSSRTIQETNEEFKAMTGTIQLGRKLITKYNRREITDKLLIFLALALFFATVLYILKKRLFPFL